MGAILPQAQACAYRAWAITLWKEGVKHSQGANASAHSRAQRLGTEEANPHHLPKPWRQPADSTVQSGTNTRGRSMSRLASGAIDAARGYSLHTLAPMKGLWFARNASRT